MLTTDWDEEENWYDDSDDDPDESIGVQITPPPPSKEVTLPNGDKVVIPTLPFPLFYA